MTEAKWLTCDAPALLLAHVRGKLSQRKDRLLAVALCSRIKGLILAQDSRLALKITEAFADGDASHEDLRIAYNAAHGVWSNYDAMGGGWDDAQIHAAEAVAYCAEPDSSFPAMLTLQRALSAAAHRGTVGSITPSFVRLVHDAVGNPFRPVAADPAWLTSTVVGLASAIYADRAFDRLPILADALEDAGCDTADTLAHCRDHPEHARGCRVVDLILGKS
jgi:hypothetical protein